MAPSYSKLYHRVAYKKNGLVVMAPSFLLLGMLRCNGFFLFYNLPSNCPRKECYVAMASSYSKLSLRVTHKLHATLQWLLPFCRCISNGQQKECYVAMAWLVGWLAGFLPQGVHTKKLIPWQARVLEMKCRFRGAGGVGGAQRLSQQDTRSQ